MRQIWYNGSLVYDPRMQGTDGYAVEAATLSTGVGSAGTLTMTLAPGHYMIGSIALMRGLVKVVETGDGTDDPETLFLGRVLRRTENFDGSLSLTCEGLLATLNDTQVPPHNWPPSGTTAENIVAAWLQWVLSWHNSEIGLAAHQITAGTCTVTATGNTMTRAAEEFASTWDTLTGEGSESELGGYLVVRYDGDTVVLDYLAEITDVCPQRIALGENMLDLTGERSGAEMYNAILAEGDDGLTLAPLPNGPQGSYYKSGLFLIDVANRDTYGLIARHVKFEGVTDTATLLAKATGALDASSGAIVSTFQVPAVDLYLVGGSDWPLRVAQLVEVVSVAHGLDIMLPVMTLTEDLPDPANTRVTLGSSAPMISRGGSGSGQVITGGGGGGGDLSNYYTKTEVNDLLAAKQSTLTFDTTPTSGSGNPVMSSGIRAAIDDAIAEKRIYIGTCDTAASAQTKAVVCDGFDLDGSAIVYVTFANSNTQSVVYLDVNGTGAVQVRNFGLSAESAWRAGETFACVYDGTYWYIPEKRAADGTYLGVVKLSNSVSSTLSSTTGRTAATPYAVKQAYDRGSEGVTAAAAAQTAADDAQDRADEAYTLADGKQDALTFDSTPTAGSSNPVTSDGIKAAINAIQPSGGGTPSTTTPLMDGTAAVGTETAYARGDHRHPTDTTRAPTSHRSAGTTYGVGTGTYYGHLKLSDSVTSTSGTDSGTAATPSAVKAAYALADSAFDLADGKSDKPALLWTNPSPTASFTNTSAITIDGIEDYNLFTFIFRDSTSDAFQISVNIYVPAESLASGWATATYRNGSTWYTFYRSVQVDTRSAQKRIQFGAGNYNGATNNSYVIPLYVIGQKL